MYRDSWWFRLQDIILDHPWLKIVAVVVGISVLANFCLSMYFRNVLASFHYEAFDDAAQVQAVLDEIVKVKIPPNFKPTQAIRSSNQNIDMLMASYVDKASEAQLAFVQSTPPAPDDSPMEQFASSATRQFDTHWADGAGEPLVRSQPVKIRGRQCSLTIIQESVPELKKFRRSAMVTFPGRQGVAGFAITYYGEHIKLDDVVMMLESIE
jgi:hypothetical protein